MARIDYIVAALRKAGLSPEDLQHLQTIVRQKGLALNQALNRSYGAPKEGTDEIIAEGVVNALRAGAHGFAPTWKSRWIRLITGELQVFEAKDRPKSSAPYMFNITLTAQQTSIDIGKSLLTTVSPSSVTSAARGFVRMMSSTLRRFSLGVHTNHAFHFDSVLRL